jgi:choline dehydrogenase
VTDERVVDFIVVGAGAAGSVVARRLHDAGAGVLAIEAGGPSDDALIADPARFPELGSSRYDWGYWTEPQANLGGRRLRWAQGRVVGGGSSVNGVVWIRGAAADYDHWAYLGNDGWSYAEVLETFRRIEDFDRGASRLRGAGGPMPVWTGWEADPIHRSVVAAMQELGVPYNDDHNGEELLGTGYCQYNVRDGRRVSAADAYLLPVAGDGGVELIVNARARRLLFEHGACVGVEWECDGRLERARATAEVIVSSGPIGSAKLLLLSGIGPAAELAEHGIDAVADVPGVGRNLHDHVHVPIEFTAERPIGPPPPGVTVMQTNTFLRTAAAGLGPDVQAPSLSWLTPYEGVEPLEGSGFTVAATIVRTASRGRLRLAGSDPDAAPLIDPATYDAPGDRASMLAGLRFLRGLAGTGALAEWGAREVLPGPAVADEELPAYVAAMTFTASHPVGTCKMGIDEDAVVDPRLRVRAVERLRVADSSIMPVVTSGNTHVPSLLIGERAAEMILAAQGSTLALRRAG